MVVSISPILAADQLLMLEHLDFLFGRALSGRVEITAIHSDKHAEYRPRTKFFAVEDLEGAAEFAASVNAEQGWNVYVGAALRKDDVFPGKAADDGDFLRTFVLWADADTNPDGTPQLDHAREVYRALGMTPPFIIVTGRTPTKRAQMWWPLETPLEDIETLRAALRGIAVALHTDPKVCTGKQLMRLGGSISWPKKEDRILERTEGVRPERAAREFSLEQIARAFPPADRATVASEIADVEIGHGGALGLEERVMDGRETYAFKLVRAHLREYLGTTGSEPDGDELYKLVAPIYLAKADQVRPGRGPEFLKQKVAEALRAYHAGQIPGMRNLEEAVQTWAARRQEDAAPDPFDDEGEADDFDGPFQASDFTGEPPERRWVVKDWVVSGAVNSLYGDGGLGKTLLAQQLACSVALGAPWLGLEVARGAVLAILCEDDKGELHRRHNAIKAAMGYSIGNPFEDVWLWPRVGLDNVLIRWDRDGKATPGPFSQTLIDRVRKLRPALVILDTLADFYGGNEIDRVQVNYFVKTVLGGLIKERADEGEDLTVLLLGHPSVAGKATGSGYSGSTAWNAAVRSRMYLSRPEEGANDARILTRGKANYASSGDETAVRLFYAEGVLHAEDDIDDGDSVLFGAKREVVRLVADAWRRKQPYTAQKGHKRFIHTALPVAMEKVGFKGQIVRQALRDAEEDGLISVSRTSDRRGFKASYED